MYNKCVYSFGHIRRTIPIKHAFVYFYKIRKGTVFMREKYETLSLATLKDLAKARGLKGVSGMKKAELIERMLEEDERDRQATR